MAHKTQLARQHSTSSHDDDVCEKLNAYSQASNDDQIPPEVAKSRTNVPVFGPAKRWMTIEPSILLYSFSFMVYIPVFSFMVMNKLCSQYCGYTLEQCNAFGTAKNSTVDAHVQKVWAIFDNYSTIFSTIPGIIFALFIGPWSDTFGRKPLLTIPFIGIAVSNIFTILLSIFPSLPLWMLFLPNIALNLLGSMTVFMTGAFSYAVYRTNAGTSRTAGIAAIDICRTTGFSLAGIFSAFLVQSADAQQKFYVCYVVALVTSILGLLYTIFRVQETRSADRAYSASAKISLFFNVRHVIVAFRTIIKKRPDRMRFELWMLLAAFCIYCITLRGEEQIYQKFFMASPLSWSLSYYLYFQSGWGLFNMFVIGVFTQKQLNLTDSTLGLLGCTSRIGFGIIIALAHSTWMAYVANFVGILKFASLVAMRALMSSTVSLTEQGALLSFLSAAEGISPMIGSFVMTAVFTATVDWWPGCFSLVGAATTVISILLILASYASRKRAGSNNEQD